MSLNIAVQEKLVFKCAKCGRIRNSESYQILKDGKAWCFCMKCEGKMYGFTVPVSESRCVKCDIKLAPRKNRIDSLCSRCKYKAL